MSRTPISDNAAFRVSDCLFESEREALVIPLDLAHKLENELNKANDRIKILEEALHESLALNINWSEEADVESLLYYSEYRAIIKQGKEALGKEI